MMTRTSASDYVKDGIHMNSVDTGWVTDEDPAAIYVSLGGNECSFFRPLTEMTRSLNAARTNRHYLV